MRKLLVAAALLLPGIAMAVPITAVLNWTPPTTTVEGLPLTPPNNLTGYRIYMSTSPILESSTIAQKALVLPSVTTWTYTGDHAAGTTLYFRVKAANSAGDSAYSNEGSKPVTVPVQVPNAPTGTTVVVTVTVSQP